MSVTTEHNGRLCNQIIRNLAVSFIAKKNDLYVEYSSHNKISNLGIELFSGTQIFDNTIILNDDNFFIIYNSNNLTSNLNANYDYFQTKEISNLIYNYLHSENIKTNIINKNPHKNRYNNNNDLCIHVRLTDVAHYNPGSNYYLQAIQTIEFDNLYITTDDVHHNIIQQLLIQYPEAIIIIGDEVYTIQFASTCKHILLSHGSFSTIIGYLSFFSNVHYPEYDPNKKWYGDIMNICSWIKHPII